MLFSSPIFFVFFAVYFLFHLATPRQYRVYLIIVGSTVFYAWWKLEYAWLPYLLMAIAFGGVRWIDATTDAASRRRRTSLSILVLFLPLAFFKYTDFAYRDVLGLFVAGRDSLLQLPLPLGISFVTFTLTAYIVDVARGRFPARPSPSTVLAYVLFFPHLIAGPILRPHELIPQLDAPRKARVLFPTAAIAIFTIGLVKKLVFADEIAQVVDAAYANVGGVSAPQALLALYGFSLQIYCDFSGYTDMAIGLALLLGIKLPNNFLRPYGAESIVEFWRRWHITLSFWLRDYVYIPLGGNRRGRPRTLVNIIVTMALAGLWHGANWTFVIWGVLHGLGVAVVHALRWALGAPIARIPRFLSVAITFHFVTVAWAFFRAPDAGRAVAMLAAPFTGTHGDPAAFLAANAFPVLLIAVFLVLHRFDDHRRVKAAVRRLRPEIVWPTIALLWILAITVSQGSSAKFIYFEF